MVAREVGRRLAAFTLLLTATLPAAACGAGSDDEPAATPSVTTQVVPDPRVPEMRVVAPAGDGPWPVVVALHGIGGTGQDMLELATHIVHSKAGHFKPDKFEDHYENALKALIKRKQEGKPIETTKDREPAKVIDLMEALRRSAGKDGAARPATRRSTAAHRRTTKKSTRSAARHRKAG